MSPYPAVEAVASALGGAAVLHADVHTIAKLEELVRAGFPYESLRAVVSHYPEAMQRQIEQLIVPRSTAQRREQTGSLSAEESARLERVARITALSEFVWESKSAAQSFLTSPHALLDGRSPLESAITDLGARRVEDLLWQLEYSLPV